MEGADVEPEIIEEIEAEPEDITDWNRIVGFFLNPVTGWSVALIVLLAVLFWNKIQKFLDKHYEQKQQREYDAKCHKDPQWVMSHYEKMEVARRKMQEQYDAQAAEHQIRAAERERQKLLEKLSKCKDLDDGQRLGNKENSSKNYKPAYSPLDGDGGGRYRAQKKSTCPGAGCA